MAHHLVERPVVVENFMIIRARASATGSHRFNILGTGVQSVRHGDAHDAARQQEFSYDSEEGSKLVLSPMFYYVFSQYRAQAGGRKNPAPIVRIKCVQSRDVGA